jgi:hypothetical protein
MRGTACNSLEGQSVRLLQQSWLPVEWARMDACAFGASSQGSSNADILLRMLAGGKAVVAGAAGAQVPAGPASSSAAAGARPALDPGLSATEAAIAAQTARYRMQAVAAAGTRLARHFSQVGVLGARGGPSPRAAVPPRLQVAEGGRWPP